MNISVNGEPRELDANVTLGALVDAEVADRRGVAIAVDGEVVPRNDWDDTTLHDGAQVEIVGAVQGG
ncbi:MAG: sulfur carrier protein ThiS [Nitriliruptoraceae bacterium]